MLNKIIGIGAPQLFFMLSLGIFYIPSESFDTKKRRSSKMHPGKQTINIEKQVQKYLKGMI